MLMNGVGRRSIQNEPKSKDNSHEPLSKTLFEGAVLIQHC